MESLKVDEKPEPPTDEIVVLSLSRSKAVRIAGSIVGDMSNTICWKLEILNLKYWFYR